MSDVRIDRSNVINVNVGILGHVDSGKTSLVKALSTLLSTAALDKNPQSQERGITLDLGFSSFTLPMPEHLKESAGIGKSLLQFTLVDCPGHASLIRTIIGGAQIIDMMILVVDANKGIQTQTAECIVIGEITTDKLVIVLNKVDLLPADEREARIDRMTNRLRKVFAKTKFANFPIIATSAAVGGEKVASVGAKCANEKTERRDGVSMNLSNTSGVAELVDLIRATIEIPRRSLEGPLYYAIDHCFSIKGHGTILTGTVLSGSVSVGSIIEIPHLQIQRKVKSMQMFHKSVHTAGQGDRVGLCVTNLDPKLIERGIAVSPGSVPLLSTAICMVKKVRFFLEVCKSNTKFHVTIGHTTIPATVLFYGRKELAAQLLAKKKTSDITGTGDSDISPAIVFPVSSDKPLSESRLHSSDSSANTKLFTCDDPEHKEKAQREKQLPIGPGQSALNNVYHSVFPNVKYPWDTDFEYQESLKCADDPIDGLNDNVWAVLQFQRPVFCPIGSLIIGSRLDTFATNAVLEKHDKNGHKGAHASQCRLAFYGPLKEAVSVEEMEKIRVFSWKEKVGEVDHITSSKNGLCTELIGSHLVKEGGSIQSFVGMKVETERGHLGCIMGPYGSGGNFRVKFSEGVPVTKGSRLILRFKRYLHDNLKLMAQSGLDEYAQERAKIIADLLQYETEPPDDGKKLSNRQKKAEKKELLGRRSLPPDSPSLAVPLSADIGTAIVPDSSSPPVSTGQNMFVRQVRPVANSNNGNDGNNFQGFTMSPVALHKSTALHPLGTSIAPIDAHDEAKSMSENTKISLTLEKQIVGASRPSSDKIEMASNQKAITSEMTSGCTSPSISSWSSLTMLPTGAVRIGIIESIKLDSAGSAAVVAIVVGAFRMEDNIRQYKDAPAHIRGKEISGELSGPWAKLGKCKIVFPLGINVTVGDVVEINIM